MIATKMIPETYLEEFLTRQALLIKSRVGLFCVLSLVIYFLSTLISYVLYPSELKIEEVSVWGVLFFGGILFLIFSRKAQTIRSAKLSAYLFAGLLLAVLTKVCILYYSHINISSALYLFLLFLVSFTIPWDPIDIIPITFMHISAFSILFLHFQAHMPEYLGGWYVDGVVFLFMGFILCLVIRRKEAVRDVENFLLLKEVEKKNEQIHNELKLATMIHKTLIPESISTDLVDIAVTYQPVYYMGGDYAKFHFTREDRLLFIICDVTGHGVSAALTVNRLHTEFERLARDDKEPGVLLKELNEFLIKDFAGVNTYLSAFCGMLDFGKMKFLYSNHGHPAQYIYKINDPAIKYLTSQTTLLGISENEKSVYQQELEFTKGDRFLLFTDGVIETKNDEGVEFGDKALQDFVMNNSTATAAIFNKGLLDELHSFNEGKFEDDVFLLNIHVKEK